MTPEELATERLIMAALMKAFTEQSTYMIGELKMDMKQTFNNLVKRTDEFVAMIEKNLTPVQKQYLEQVTDIYHNMNLEVRKNLNNQYKQLKDQENAKTLSQLPAAV